MLQIEEASFHDGIGLWRLGFRPFFLGAGVFAALLMAVWMGIYQFGWSLAPAGYAPPVWHAHEMIYGYGMAVIAGFLLTAVKNWTGVQTLHGYPLMGLFGLWLAARLSPFAVSAAVVFLLDMLFMLAFFAAVLYPVIKSRSWSQMGIVAIVFLLAVGNLLFYLGLTGVVGDGVRQGLHAGVYLVVALILVVGRRVIPFFIERGCGFPLQLINRPWLDNSIMVLFGLFAVVDVFAGTASGTALLAAALLFLNGIRLRDWYTPAIWKKPLLWVLYVAYVGIIAGFLFKAVALAGVSVPLAVHAFTVGGIGMMTLGMMARVALGHTGRNVFEPPSSVWWMFLLLAGAAVVRVLFPLLFEGQYRLWVSASQLLWIAAFALFVFVYTPILVKPRVDGRYG